MIKVFIDEIPVFVEKYLTILQACEKINVTIPRFCFHKELLIAGNCRMCLVELEKSPKPVVSCSMPVMNNMKIFTNTPLVKKARENILEFLLINHPLDCPICDQGGECDLQDQTFLFGSDRSRFYNDNKRGVQDKNCGPIVKTIMTRCIHCTRCVRFLSEIAGLDSFGTTSRGKYTEIGTYIEKSISSELSGNIVDLCPVGALTNKSYSFISRPWELKSTKSIDILDPLCPSISVDSRGNEILRILPNSKNELNNLWITDKTRYSFDGLKKQQLVSPLFFINNSYKKITWSYALNLLKIRLENKNISGSEIGVVSGPFIDLQTSLLIKNFLSELGSNNYNLGVNPLQNNNIDFTYSYCLNKLITSLNEFDVCILIGANPRIESPLLNLRLRKLVLQNKLVVLNLGLNIDLTYKSFNLGLTSYNVISLFEGKNKYSKYLLKNKNILVLVGESVYNREDFNAISSFIKGISHSYLSKYIQIFNINTLNSNVSKINTSEIGLNTSYKSNITRNSKIKILFLINTNSINLCTFNKDVFIVYIGHTGTNFLNNVDLILPCLSFLEKKATFLNLEGRIQKSNTAFSNLNLKRLEWKIINALLIILNKTNYNSTSVVNNILLEISPRLNDIQYKINNITVLENNNIKFINKILNSLSNCLFDNFYMSDIISKHSPILANVSSYLKLNNFK